MMINGFGSFGFGNDNKNSENREDSKVHDDIEKENDVLLDDEDVELDKDFFIDKSNQADKEETIEEETIEEETFKQPEEKVKPELTQIVNNTSGDYLPSYEVGVMFTSKKDFDNFLNEFNENYHKMSQYFYQLGDGQIDENLSIRDRNVLIKKISDVQTEMYMSYNRFNDKILANINDLRRFLVSTNVDFNSFDRFLNDDEIKTERLNVDEVSFYDDTLR